MALAHPDAHPQRRPIRGAEQQFLGLVAQDQPRPAPARGRRLQLQAERQPAQIQPLLGRPARLALGVGAAPAAAEHPGQPGRVGYEQGQVVVGLVRAVLDHVEHPASPPAQGQRLQPAQRVAGQRRRAGQQHVAPGPGAAVGRQIQPGRVAGHHQRIDPPVAVQIDVALGHHLAPRTPQRPVGRRAGEAGRRLRPRRRSGGVRRRPAAVVRRRNTAGRRGGRKARRRPGHARRAGGSHGVHGAGRQQARKRNRRDGDACDPAHDSPAQTASGRCEGSSYMASIRSR